MHRLRLAGLFLSALGFLGYSIGVTRPYPGRAFSIAALMVGVTLVGIQRLERAGEAR